MYISPDRFRDEEERLQQLEEAEALRQLQEQQRLQTSEQQRQYVDEERETLTPAEAARTAKVSKEERPSGWSTEIGEAASYLLDGGPVKDALNATAAGINQLTPDDSPLKPLTQGVDDFILGAEEGDQAISQQIGDRLNSEDPAQRIRGSAQAALYAVEKGPKSGLISPVTMIGRVAGEATPWSNRPEVLKDSPVGSALFNITEVLVPSLALPGGTGLKMIGSLAIESAIETGVQTETNDDLIAGRTLARSFGEVADFLGYEGGELTKELIEGKTFKSQAFTAVMGYLQNLGINVGAAQISRLLPGAQVTESADEVQAAARVSKKSSEEAAESIDNQIPAPYRSDAEPTDVITADTAVGTSAPSAGKAYINDDALVAQALKANGFDASGYSPTNYRHFATLDRLKDEQGMEELLNEAAKAATVFNSASKDKAAAMAHASNWYQANKGFIEEDNFDAVALDFASEPVLQRTLKEKQGIEYLAQPDVDDYLKEYAEVTPEGFLATALVGEQIGMKGIRLATLAGNYDSAGIDFTNIVNQFAELVDKSELFRIPQLRGKRNWYVGGELQQKKNIARAKDDDVIDSLNKSQNPELLSPSRDFSLIKRTEDDPGATFNELWIKAQEGDTEALKTVKTYMRAVAAAEPENAFKTITDLNKALRRQLMRGTTEATQQLYYAAMLGRISTQVASMASGIGRFIAEPLGAVASPLLAGGSTDDMMYGLGQLYGSFGALKSGLKAGRRAFQTEIPLNTGSKLDSKVRTASQRAAQMDGAIEQYRQQLKADGEELSMNALTAELHYNYQRWSNTPLNRNGERLLTAQDEGYKVAFASQVATGRAFQKAAQNKDWKNLKTYIDAEMESIFRHGIENGKITDKQVLDAGRALTFQSNIPTDGNAIDNLFLGIQNVGGSGAIGKFFFPFVRASYNMLEVAARYEPSGALNKAVPRYQKILKGEMGEAARLQLQSQISFGRLQTAAFVMAAAGGMATGFNVPDGVPRTSILIPANNKDGYLAVDYSRLEPFASYLAVISDLVNSFRNGAIAERDYDRIAQELVFSIASASFDKTFTTGLNDLASLIDFKDADYKFYNVVTKLSGNAVSTPFGTVSALTRMIGSWSNPNQTIAKDPNSWWSTYFNTLRQRLTGGIGLPQQHDPLSGEVISFSPMPNENPIVSGVGAMLNEMGWPGRIRQGEVNPNVDMLGRLGFDISKGINTKEHEGLSLSPPQQSEYSKAIHTVGRLNDRLTLYFNSPEFKKERRIMDRAVQAQGTSSKGTAAAAARDRVFAKIRVIINFAKSQAGAATVERDPDYIQRRQLSQGRGKVSQVEETNLNPTQERAEGLIAWSKGELGLSQVP